MEVQLYKLWLVCIKYLPSVIGVCYFISSILGCFGIILPLFSVMIQLSVLPSLFILLSSFTFKCCVWHRLPIYYCWTVDIVSFIDAKIGIPIQNHVMLLCYMLIALSFTLYGAYLKNKYNERTRKESSQ